MQVRTRLIPGEWVATLWSHRPWATQCTANKPLASAVWKTCPALTESDIQNISMFNSGGEVEPSIREKLTEEAAKEGGRNDKLARLVGKWIKEGWGMREILIKAQDWNQSCDPPLSIVETATTTLSIAQGHIKRHPEDIDAGVNEWKTSEWQTQISEDLKQIQDQEYPVEVEDAPEMGPLGLQPFQRR